MTVITILIMSTGPSIKNNSYYNNNTFTPDVVPDRVPGYHVRPTTRLTGLPDRGADPRDFVRATLGYKRVVANRRSLPGIAKENKKTTTRHFGHVASKSDQLRPCTPAGFLLHTRKPI
jgi:hypothetical protein